MVAGQGHQRLRRRASGVQLGQGLHVSEREMAQVSIAGDAALGIDEDLCTRGCRLPGPVGDLGLLVAGGVLELYGCDANVFHRPISLCGVTWPGRQQTTLLRTG